MKKIISVLMVVCVLAVFASAEVYIKQKSHTDAVEFMGQKIPEKIETNELWLGNNKMAMHGPEGSVILNLDKKNLLMINHQDKSYVEMTLPLEIDKYFPAQMMQMMGNVTIKVTPTGQTEKLGQWNCSIYDMEMSMMMFTTKMKVWASKDVPFDWKEFNEKMYSQFAMATMRLGPETTQELKKIEGYQVKTEITVNMMGASMKTLQQVEEISSKNAPAGTFDAPAGYAKKDKFTMEDMQRR